MCNPLSLLLEDRGALGEPPTWTDVNLYGTQQKVVAQYVWLLAVNREPLGTIDEQAAAAQQIVVEDLPVNAWEF